MSYPEITIRQEPIEFKIVLRPDGIEFSHRTSDPSIVCPICGEHHSNSPIDERTPESHIDWLLGLGDEGLSLLDDEGDMDLAGLAIGGGMFLGEVRKFSQSDRFTLDQKAQVWAKADQLTAAFRDRGVDIPSELAEFWASTSNVDKTSPRDLADNTILAIRVASQVLTNSKNSPEHEESVVGYAATLLGRFMVLLELLKRKEGVEPADIERLESAIDQLKADLEKIGLRGAFHLSADAKDLPVIERILGEVDTAIRQTTYAAAALRGGWIPDGKVRDFEEAIEMLPVIEMVVRSSLQGGVADRKLNELQQAAKELEQEWEAYKKRASITA